MIQLCTQADWNSVMNEKRKFRRYDLQLPSHIYKLDGGQDEHIASKTCNISSGGAFFFTNNALDVGTKVEIELLLPIKNLYPSEGYTASIVKSTGYVVRTETKGMAVAFEAANIINPVFASS